MNLKKEFDETTAMMRKLLSLGVSGILSIICLAISWAMFKVILIQDTLGELWFFNPRILLLGVYVYGMGLTSYIFYRLAVELFEGPPKSGDAPPDDGNLCHCIKPAYEVVGKNGDRGIVCATCGKPIQGVFISNKGAN